MSARRAIGRCSAGLAYRGLLVGEYGLRSPDIHADGRRQSRLLVMLTAAVVVIEPDPPGLASGCINAATKAGRPVLAIPGPIDSRAYGYTHHLIRAERARLVNGTSDILADLTTHRGGEASGGLHCGLAPHRR